MALERKPLGSWYVVILKTEEFSHARNFATGAFGGEGRYPAPELGTRCVCCDAETTLRRPFDPSMSRNRAVALDIPVCKDCETHVASSTSRAQMLGAGFCVGIGLALWAAMKQMWGLALLGVLALALVVGVVLSARAKRRAMAHGGHHTGLEIIVAAHGMCSIRTTNFRLASEVAERNAELVSKAR